MADTREIVALVTGASSGIGAAIAEYLAAQGVYVGLVARRADRLHQVEKRIATLNGTCHLLIADISNEQQICSAVDEFAKINGHIDVLINNAGVMSYGKLEDQETGLLDQMIDTNIKGTLYTTKAVLPYLKKSQHNTRHIVNISSDAGKSVFDNLVVYSATKHFIEAFTIGIRRELAHHNIKVTSIQPGDVYTELIGAIPSDPRYIPQTSDILDPQHIAHIVWYVLTQPRNVALNEVLVEPLKAPI